MTAQAKYTINWTLIVTLATLTIGFAAAYGQKAEQQQVLVFTVKEQGQRLSQLESNQAAMAADIRVIRYILEGKEPTH
jgi:hypothetical protein